MRLWTNWAVDPTLLDIPVNERGPRGDRVRRRR